MAHLCLECYREFILFKDLRKHIKKFHAGKLDELAPLPVRYQPYVCTFCPRKYGAKRNLTMHMKEHIPVHPSQEKEKKKKKKKCPLCEFVGKFKHELYDHFRNNHDIVIETENLYFSTEQEFKDWITQTEKTSRTRFILERGSTGNQAHYICHRSGSYNPKINRKRILKSQGSKKINGFCPAGVEVSIDAETERHYITYIKNHIGHEGDELSHLTLTTDEREMLASKIDKNIPFNEILDEIRNNAPDASLERIHLIKKKDLHNIASAVKLNGPSRTRSEDSSIFEEQKAVFDESQNVHGAISSESNFEIEQEVDEYKEDIVVNIDSWVDKIKESCVLFYKAQSVILEQHPQLNEDDFILIIMTQGQKLIFNEYSKDCVCIDSFYDVRNSNFDLHTLFVFDELLEAIPCAFFVTNRSDQNMMNIFLECVKREVGLVKTRVFMSDIDDSSYNAWQEIMIHVPKRLINTWKVKEHWKENLGLITSKAKQPATYKMLLNLLTEVSPIKFCYLLNMTVKFLFEDVERCEFAKFFNVHYMKNSQYWAFCYQRQYGFNTNNHICELHNRIEDIHLSGIKNEGIVKAVEVLMKLVETHLLDKLVSLDKGKISCKLTEIQDRHDISLSFTLFSLVKTGDRMWQIVTPTISRTVYTVYENQVDCKSCQLRCSDCNKCIHNYICDCPDSRENFNMCLHIHILCKHKHEARCRSYLDL